MTTAIAAADAQTATFSDGAAGQERPVTIEALAQAEARAAHLEIALISNRTIGIALGLIMASYHLSPEAAFGLITRISQEANTKVSVLAERMIANHLAELGG